MPTSILAMTVNAMIKSLSSVRSQKQNELRLCHGTHVCGPVDVATWKQKT